jgi:predicted ATPase
MGGSKMARVKIKELRLSHFRAFENACLELDDKLTVIVGRNGSGKSTLMDAFEFLRSAVSDNLDTAIDRQGGLQGIRQRQSGKARRFDVSLAVVLDVEEKDIERHQVLYGFKLGAYGNEGFGVKNEMLLTNTGWSEFRRGEKDFQFSDNVRGVAPVINQNSLALPIIGGSSPLWSLVAEALGQIRTYNLEPSAIGGEPDIDRVTWLERYGKNAGDVLTALQRGKPEAVKWIVRHLDAILPGIVEVQGQRTQYGKRRIAFEQKAGEGTTHKYTAARMSDGTLRSLGILLALQQEPTPTLVFIDEVEDSIHPGALGVILDAISASEDRMQVVISSHSTELLDRDQISAKQIRVVEWRDGVSTIHRPSEKVIKAVDGPYEDVLQPGEASYSVGELLRINALYTEDEPSMVGGGKFFEVPK